MLTVLCKPYVADSAKCTMQRWRFFHLISFLMFRFNRLVAKTERIQTYLQNNDSWTVTEAHIKQQNHWQTHKSYVINIWKKINEYFIWRKSAPPLPVGQNLERFLDHTQRRTTVGRTPLDEWSARSRDLYLTTHNTHNRRTSMFPVGFEPTISAG